MPPDKLTPIIFGLAFGAFGSGNAVGSVTLTIVICCLALVPVLVRVRLMVLPGCMFDVLTAKPAGDPAMGVAAVVWSDNALDIVAASWSIWVCACTRVWSRNVRSAAIWPELIDLLATMS